MSRVRQALRHPFTHAALLVVLAYVLFEFGIAYLPPLLGVRSAPVPGSVLVQYMMIALVGILIYVSSDDDRWREFKRPVHSTMVDADKRWLRVVLLVLVPVLAGFATYEQTRPRVEAPLQLRSIHPAPPSQITFRGKTVQLTGLENPLRSRGSLSGHYLEGRRVYYQNCLACHGDLLAGDGHYAHGFSPAPLSFTDGGTIAQLTESFVFWRIAKGGPGLPREGAPWNSAMPAWEDFLTEDEIWAVIIFLYQQSGWQPRRWEVHESPGQGQGQGQGGAHD
ncbi:MAG: cytochrome c [Gemmatimonadota bacterium]|nr:cytochrome c [Gemmatimonadota bacterium]